MGRSGPGLPRDGKPSGYSSPAKDSHGRNAASDEAQTSRAERFFRRRAGIPRPRNSHRHDNVSRPVGRRGCVQRGIQCLIALRLRGGVELALVHRLKLQELHLMVALIESAETQPELIVVIGSYNRGQ